MVKEIELEKVNPALIGLVEIEGLGRLEIINAGEDARMHPEKAPVYATAICTRLDQAWKNTYMKVPGLGVAYEDMEGTDYMPERGELEKQLLNREVKGKDHHIFFLLVNPNASVDNIERRFPGYFEGIKTADSQTPHEFKRLYLAEDIQGKRIASTLFQKMEVLLPGKPIRGEVPAFNGPSLRNLERYGFEEVGRIPSEWFPGKQVVQLELRRTRSIQ